MSRDCTQARVRGAASLLCPCHPHRPGQACLRMKVTGRSRAILDRPTPADNRAAREPGKASGLPTPVRHVPRQVRNKHMLSRGYPLPRVTLATDGRQSPSSPGEATCSDTHRYAPWSNELQRGHAGVGADPEALLGPAPTDESVGPSLPSLREPVVGEGDTGNQRTPIRCFRR